MGWQNGHREEREIFFTTKALKGTKRVDHREVRKVREADGPLVSLSALVVNPLRGAPHFGTLPITFAFYPRYEHRTT